MKTNIDSTAAAARPFRPKVVRMLGAANDVAVIAPISEEIGHADHWFQVSPFGRFPHRVGLQVFDRQAANSIVAFFKSQRDRLARLWRGLPVYVGHPDLDPKQYADHKKYGSIQELEVREDGLWARPKWSKAGKEIVNDEHYDFQSPLWNLEPIPNEPGAFRPVELISVGLTNRPNIPGNPVGANTADAELEPMKRIDLIQKLGLQPAAGSGEVTDEQIDAALGRWQQAANEQAALADQLRAAREARAEAERQRADAVTRAANERTARIRERLAAAVQSGRISEAETAGWQTRFETDFAGAEAALGALLPAMNTRQGILTADLGRRNAGDVAASRTERIQAANRAVDQHMKESGTTDYPAAFAWVQKNRPELFRGMHTPETKPVS